MGGGPEGRKRMGGRRRVNREGVGHEEEEEGVGTGKRREGKE